jgi:hypothetical protein
MITRNPKFVFLAAVCVFALWGAYRIGTGQANTRLLDPNEMCSQARGADPTPCDRSLLTDNCVDNNNLCFNQNGNGTCTGGCSMCTIQLNESWCAIIAPLTVNQCVNNTTSGGCGVFVNSASCQTISGICTCVDDQKGNSKIVCDQRTATANKKCN